jgi:hypothetical protein
MPWNTVIQTLFLFISTPGTFSGLFGYSPSVGLGNLFFSVSVTGGTDPSGNNYPSGIVSYSNNFYARLVSANLQLNATGTQITTPALITLTATTFTSGQSGLALVSPSNGAPVTFPQSEIILLSASRDTTLPSTIQMSGGLIHNLCTLLQAGTLNIDTNVGFLNAAPAGIVATWQSITPTNGWTQRAGNMAFEAKLFPDNRVWLKGVLIPGTKTDGTSIGTMPAGLFNTNEQIQIPIGTSSSTTNMTNAPFVQISTSGNITVNGVNLVGLANIFINGFIPLDGP